MIEDAVAEELMPQEKNHSIKSSLKPKEAFRKFLLDDELAKIEDQPLKEGNMLDYHRKLYIFSAYTGGIRISDLLFMRWKNFTGKHLYFQVRKTGEGLSIKLPEKSLEIISYYKDLAIKKQGTIDPESFIFLLLNIPLDETNNVAVFNAISSATAYTNKSLGKILELAGSTKISPFIQPDIVGP